MEDIRLSNWEQNGRRSTIRSQDVTWKSMGGTDAEWPSHGGHQLLRYGQGRPCNRTLSQFADSRQLGNYSAKPRPPGGMPECHPASTQKCAIHVNLTDDSGCFNSPRL